MFNLIFAYSGGLISGGGSGVAVFFATGFILFATIYTLLYLSTSITEEKQNSKYKK